MALALSSGIAAWRAKELERRWPNIGTRIDIGDMHMNVLHLQAGPSPDLPPIVFIHGASGNLRDQAYAFRSELEGRAELLFIDRPGHGYSDRGGAENARPDGQAHALARTMDKLGIKRAIIVGHSFGGAIAASFAVLHPEKTAGLLFLSPATHPWPGGVDWYYDLASTPVVGPLFSYAIALHAGMARLDTATVNVFAPNPRPDRYIEETGAALVLRPDGFRWNAIDVSSLHDYVANFAPRYREIEAPTVIITGDSDDIVLEEIHSRGLERDIAGSELLWIKGLGHKPDYVVTDVAIAALEKIAGRERDLHRLALEAEGRIAATRNSKRAPD
ncbi:alpha/beta hydrolase [Ciceribacter sp. L1K22]|uniref:alpha/beta fold hydrolase n=1 Tax=Ciceribacter sp. L1K22 TaxID=2820275 RepID=UPI001ABDCCA8|nr:alpha/beta hydrolase [Ciceribacter sp. L1K22]MBO3761868.1 alpha/beta hydrolase [Ciceribacter sp. L1K22]